MSLEPYEVYPNARVTYGGSDVTVYDVNAEVISVVQDDGEVKRYLTDVFTADGSPYEPPQEPTPTPAPAPAVNPPAPVQPAPVVDPTPAPAPSTDPTPAPAPSTDPNSTAPQPAPNQQTP